MFTTSGSSAPQAAFLGKLAQQPREFPRRDPGPHWPARTPRYRVQHDQTTALHRTDQCPRSDHVSNAKCGHGDRACSRAAGAFGQKLGAAIGSRGVTGRPFVQMTVGRGVDRCRGCKQDVLCPTLPCGRGDGCGHRGGSRRCVGSVGQVGREVQHDGSCGHRVQRPGRQVLPIARIACAPDRDHALGRLPCPVGPQQATHPAIAARHEQRDILRASLRHVPCPLGRLQCHPWSQG